jgi:hypothetical protein
MLGRVAKGKTKFGLIILLLSRQRRVSLIWIATYLNGNSNTNPQAVLAVLFLCVLCASSAAGGEKGLSVFEAA